MSDLVGNPEVRFSRYVARMRQVFMSTENTLAILSNCKQLPECSELQQMTVIKYLLVKASYDGL